MKRLARASYGYPTLKSGMHVATPVGTAIAVWVVVMKIVCAAVVLGWSVFAHTARAQTAQNTAQQSPTASFDAIPTAPASVNPIPQPAGPVRAPSAQPAPLQRACTPTQPTAAPFVQPWTERWYGWQVLIADASSFGLVTLGVAGTNQSYGQSNTARSLVLVGSGGYFLAAPIIHLSHHRVGAAVGSLAMRVVLPVFAGAVGASAQTCPRPGAEDWGNCGLEGAVEGVIVGAILASVVDATLNSVGPQTLGRDDEHETKHAPSLGLSPALSADGKRGELRLFGTF
ncbi:MAG: hypothetical protein ABJB12_18050 [Pseudomonadota bacterium]